MRRLIRKTIVIAALCLAASPAFAASGKNDYIRNIWVNNLFRAAGTALPTAFYIRLYPTGTCPTATTAGTEYTGNAYAAITCGASGANGCQAATGNWEATNGGGGAATAGLLKNTNVLTFPTVTTANWAIQCVAITTATASQVLYFGDLTSAPVTVNVGATASFAADALTIQEAMRSSDPAERLAALVELVSGSVTGLHAGAYLRELEAEALYSRFVPANEPMAVADAG